MNPCLSPGQRPGLGADTLSIRYFPRWEYSRESDLQPLSGDYYEGACPQEKPLGLTSLETPRSMTCLGLSVIRALLARLGSSPGTYVGWWILTRRGIGPSETESDDGWTPEEWS